MFISNDDYKREIAEAEDRGAEKAREDHEREIKTLTLDHDHAVKDLKKSHELALKDKDQELKHFKDNELKKALDEKIELEKKLAIAEQENKGLQAIVDLNADLVDVKGLINKLIEKLPQFDLKSLTINTTAGGSKGA